MSNTTTFDVPAGETDVQPGPSPVGDPTRAAIGALVFLVCLALTLFINWRFRFELNDDAYIHLRIAGNLVKTGHAYFNQREPVMATSSPLWTLFLAATEVLFGNANLLWFWNALFVSVAATAGYLLAWDSLAGGGWTRKLLAFVLPLTVIAALADSSLMGMETPLAMALLFLATLAFVESSAAALPLLALASLTRYELAPLFIVAAAICVATRSARRYGAIAATAIVAAFTAILFSQYGTVIPNAIKAKNKGYIISASEVFERLRPGRPPMLETFEGMLLLLALAALAFWTWETVRSRKGADGTRWAALSLMLWGCVLGLLYMSAKALIFVWYVPLVWAPILVGAFLAIIAERSVWRKTAASLVLISIFLVMYVHLGFLVHSALTNRVGEIALVSETGRAHEYLAVGRALRQECPASGLMTSEIGALGYAFQGHILDGFGIASPEAIKYHPMPVPEQRQNSTIGAIPPGFVEEMKPDLIVTYDFLGEAVLRSPYVIEEYDDVRLPPVLPQDSAAGRQAPWGIQTLHVLVRRDGGCPISKAIEGLSVVFQAQPPAPAL